jgi:hypothetical protein
MLFYIAVFNAILHSHSNAGITSILQKLAEVEPTTFGSRGPQRHAAKANANPFLNSIFEPRPITWLRQKRTQNYYLQKEDWILFP